jgi:hypothetical protein
LTTQKEETAQGYRTQTSTAVVAFYPEDIIVFRNADPYAPRTMFTGWISLRLKDPKAISDWCGEVTGLQVVGARRSVALGSQNLGYAIILLPGESIDHPRLRFATAVRGPLLLGRDSHKGGGVFVIER